MANSKLRNKCVPYHLICKYRGTILAFGGAVEWGEEGKLSLSLQKDDKGVKYRQVEKISRKNEEI